MWSGIRLDRLFSLSARLGALLAGADDAYQEPLRLYGERVGIAFQLADDLIDIRASKKDSGKVAGTDILAGVPTLPALLLTAYEDEDSKAFGQRHRQSQRG
jgi:heptaprenyl diphosphate synthase